MKWKRCPAYKDSGVEWIDDLPSSWTELPLKWCVHEKNNVIESTELSYVGLEHVESWTGSAKPIQFETDSISGKHFSCGDVQLNKLRPYLAKGFIAENEGVCSGEFLVLRPTKVLGEFLLRVLLSPEFVQLVDSSTYGAKMPRANWEFIRGITIPVPPNEEQKAISSFLNRQTERIDSLIAKKQRQIELLEEKRTALITHAVTKGLDPNVKMKDSGVEWLGEVPEHWDVLKFGLCVATRSGEFIASSDVLSEQNEVRKIPVVGGTGVMGYCDGFNEQGTTVVIGRVGAQCGNIHVFSEKVWVTDNALVVKRQSGFADSFLAHVLRAMRLNDYASQNAQPLITGTIIKGQSIVRPPIEEQRAISQMIEKESASIYELGQRIHASIVALQEYRSALISAAVTGQIDVRKEV